MEPLWKKNEKHYITTDKNDATGILLLSLIFCFLSFGIEGGFTRERFVNHKRI